MLRSVILLIVSLLPAAAQFDPAVSPREMDRTEGAGLPFGSVDVPETDEPDRSPLLMAELRGLVLRGGGAGVARAPGASPVVRIEGVSPALVDPLAAAVSAWIGSPLTERGLDRLTDAILAVYQRNGRPVVDIAVPDQDLAAGRLVVEITEGRVGAVGMERTRHFNDELLGGAIHLEEGELLTTGRLHEQLDWLNRNPFRSASMFAAPGEGIGEADFVFTFEESRPWRVYTGYENSGTEAAGEHRFLAGINWGNAFGLDHVVGYQVTVGESLDRFQAHAVSWEIPLHELHRYVRINATWADIEARGSSGGMPINAEGETWAVSAAWGIPLPRAGDFRRELRVGAEFKATDNFLTFGEIIFPGQQVEIVQGRIDFETRARWEESALEASLSLVASPGGLSARNDDASFDAFRAGADAGYIYLAGQAAWVRRLPESWSLRLAAQGQLADGKLLPIEQLAFGGHDTIRGFDEREFLADSGYILTGEVRSPAVSLGVGVLPEARLQVLTFLDHGTGWRRGDGSNSFTGAGAGLRLDAGDTGELRFDLAWPLGESGGPEAHAGVLVAF
ncbi:MAG: ShlB/FhaC/HecB family hemolysin secretion/activation protein [Akkermansiaceae bacterium]|nr:ShlB/FhaC/HecB family hemolysin secretion/activation protein [Akkermansiaceae bacterium]